MSDTEHSASTTAHFVLLGPLVLLFTSIAIRVVMLWFVKLACRFCHGFSGGLCWCFRHGRRCIITSRLEHQNFQLCNINRAKHSCSLRLCSQCTTHNTQQKTSSNTRSEMHTSEIQSLIR